MRSVLPLVLCAAAACVSAPPSPAPARQLTVAEVPPAYDDDAAAEPIAAPPEGDGAHNRTESGVTWTVLSHGTGRAHPGINDSVKVHYEGWTADGVRFDSSLERGPATFGVTKVIAGWTEVLQLMVLGDKWRVHIPAALAYGVEPGQPGRPSGDLTFEVELIEIIAAPPVPADVAAPSLTSSLTSSGLAYRVLKHGGGNVHPTTADDVEVHYSGWTTDGKMFDSSVVRGRAARFGVTDVIKGWTESLQLMVEGDVYRVWIPPDLAYGVTPARPGAPAGMLVFDIELIRIHP